MRSINPKNNILHILLKGTLCFCAIATIVSVTTYTRSRLNSTVFVGDNPINTIAGTIFFLILFLSSRKRPNRGIRMIFVLSFVVIGLYCSIKWGADVPIALLLYILSIIFTGLIISGSSAIVLNILILSCLIIIIFLQVNKLLVYDYSWVQRQIEIIDGVVIGLILSIVSLVSWLSNREIEKSLNRALESEKNLRIERDNLESLVEKRTVQLFISQAEKISQMYKFAEFGKLAAGLVHELVNPLASVSLNLEQLKNVDIKNIKREQLSKILSRAALGAKTMESYIRSAKKQIQYHDDKSKFSVKESIFQCIKLFEYRATTERVVIIIKAERQVFLIGSSVHFQHIINNLISNSLDSFRSYQRDNKQILIMIESINKEVIIRVIDNGKGIRSKDYKRVFMPFFTTKKGSGTGLGLSLTKELIQNSFGGTIEILTSTKRETIFEVKIPIRNYL